MFNLTPQEWMVILTIAIWIDGLWLIKLIIWKPRPKLTAVTLRAKEFAKADALAELDSWRN